ncbi:cytochrome P450 [Xylariales sp. PMI_506]|nr:cytochrome P450 [Xylariales sp. PMI_506]
MARVLTKISTGSLPANLAILGFLSIGCLVLTFFFKRAQRDARIRQMGCVRAPSVARDPINALFLIILAEKYRAQDRLSKWYDHIYSFATPESPNAVELEIYPSQRFVITRDPEHMKTILTTKFADFGKGEEFHRLWEPFLGNSIFTTDGKSWHDSRSLIRPMFMKDRVSDLEIFDRNTGALMTRLPPSGTPFGLQDLLYRMTLDIAVEFLFGSQLNCLDNPRNSFVRAFDEVQRLQMEIMMTYPFDMFVDRKSYRRHIKTIEEFVMPFIQQSLALPPAELDKLVNSDKSFTFLHHLASFTRDEKVIRDQLIAILLAGRDTTAATLSWTFYQLSIYPEKWKRLRDEVLSTVGQERPSYSDLKSMRYLRYTILETLRLYPAVPYNIRTALVDTKLPGAPGQPDIAILAGENVGYTPMVMQRRQDLYPAGSVNAETFSPERWFDWQPKPWEFIPFNGGPRICIGQNFAMTEMAYFMVRMLQKYERLEYRGDWSKQLIKADLIGRPKYSVTIALYEA